MLVRANRNHRLPGASPFPSPNVRQQLLREAPVTCMPLSGTMASR